MKVVINALSVEYRRIEGRLDGATKRLDHARAQVEIEKKIIQESIADLLLLETTILNAGGVVPKLLDGEEPYFDEEAPKLPQGI